MLFYMIFAFVVVERLIELFIARKNEHRMRAQGAYEVGARHYPYMFLLHVGFLVSLLIEVQSSAMLNEVLLFIFILLQLVRVWCIHSLGMFWNTKILILPGAKLVARGPYKLLRHPNYVIVCLEIAVLPLMFQAYVTAIFFTVLNALMLAVRIPEEERALRQIS